MQNGNELVDFVLAKKTSMTGPTVRWTIHHGSDSLVPLPSAAVTAVAPPPLYLDRTPLLDLDEASEPDHFIAKLNMMRNGEALPGSSVEQHECARATRRAWRAAGNANPHILMFLTAAALVTRGGVLRLSEVAKLHAMNEISAFRNKLRELIDAMQASPNWARYGTG